MMKNLIICKNKAFSREDFISLCIESGTQSVLAQKIGCSTKTVRACLKKYFSDKPENKPLKGYMLELLGLSECSKCKQKLPFNDFYARKGTEKGITSACKTCLRNEQSIWRRENPEKVKQTNDAYKKRNPEKVKVWGKKYNAKRKARLLECQPPWVSELDLLDIYEGCPEGHHVDHIIPLQGEKVCGLHVPANLQYLPTKENLSKGNKFEV